MLFSISVQKAALVAFAGAVLAGHASAITLGQNDDFQDGTTQNWGGGSPQNVSGGQGGTSDLYLRQISTGGFGQGSHMAVFNLFQWSGDYQAAGVSAVAVDMKNEGSTTLEMRAVLFSSVGSQFVTSYAAVLPPTSGWQRVVFLLREQDLVRVSGSSTYGQTITGVQRFMFRHDPGSPSSTGVSIVATLGFDNITALAATNDVAPNSFGMFRGFVFSGGLASLINSDDSSLAMRPGPVLNGAEAPCQLTVSGTSPVANPSALQFRLEARASVFGLSQTISLFNFTTNAYELMDTRNVSLSDSVVTVTPGGTLSRFVHPASREVRARMGWKETGPVLSYPWTAYADHTQWRITL